MVKPNTQISGTRIFDSDGDVNIRSNKIKLDYDYYDSQQFCGDTIKQTGISQVLSNDWSSVYHSNNKCIVDCNNYDQNCGYDLEN